MPIKKWLIESLTVVRLKEPNAGQQNTGSSSDCHCCSRGACQMSWNLIVTGKPAPQALPSSCVSAPLTYCPLILFIDNFTDIYYAAQPDSSTWSFLTSSIVIRDKTLLTTARTQHDVDQKLGNGSLSSLSQRTRCGQWSAGSSGHTSWADFSEFFEVTRIQVHIEERERKSKGVENRYPSFG